MKRLVAALITAIVMTLMTWTALSRPRSGNRPNDATRGSGLTDDTALSRESFAGATERIEGLLSSARKGDVAAYLAAFSGSLRDRLTRESEAIGNDQFARQLRRSSEARKSHAVFAPEPLGREADGVWITAESTFADRIERQRFRLERFPTAWLVTEIETAREHVPKERLGSLATYQEPEGPPVTTAAEQPAVDETEND